MKKNGINPSLKASIFYIFGNGIGQGVILLGTIVFSRIMTQEEYGLYSTYYSMVSILTTVVGVNLFISLNTAYLDYRNDIRAYRKSILVLSFLVFSLISVIVLVGKQLLGMELSQFLLVMALVHAYSFFIVNYYNQSANMENRYKIKTVLLILPNLLQVILPIIFIFTLQVGTLNARVLGSVLAVFGCACFSAWCVIREKGKCYNREYWKYALKISVPSVLSSISYMLMQQSDKLMLTAFFSAEDTAVYALVYNVGYILYAVLQATNGAWQAWLYRTIYNDNLDNVQRVQKWYLYAFAVMAHGLLMISAELVKILGGEEYWKFEYIPPFILGSCLMLTYTFYTTVGTLYKKTGAVSMCVFVAAIVNVVLNAMVIPIWGGVGAAYTSAVSYLVLFILAGKLSEKLKPRLFSLKCFLLFFCAIVLGAILFMMVYENIVARYLIFSGLILIEILYVYCKRQEITALIKTKQ